MNTENKNNQKVIWVTNILLFGFVYMDFVTNMRSRIAQGNNVGNFIMAIVLLANLLVYASINNKSESKKINIGKKINILIAILFVMSVVGNNEKPMLYNIRIYIVAVMVYLVCLKVFVHYFKPNQIIYITMVCAIGIVVLSCIHYVVSLDPETGERMYTFENRKVYEKYKSLHDDPEAYVIWDYSEDSIYVRELLWETTHYFTFDNKEEYESFVDNQTLGKGVFVPVLGGGGEFNDKEFSIKYWEQHKNQTPEYMKDNLIHFYVMFMLWTVAVSCVGALREKKKNISTV